MKKVFLTLACVSFLAFSITSCEKTCTCTTTIDGVDMGTVETKAKKCADLESESTLVGITTKVACK